MKLAIIQGKNSKLKGEKLKTQAKNSRFRQNQKRGLPKIGRKKKAAITTIINNDNYPNPK